MDNKELIKSSLIEIGFYEIDDNKLGYYDEEDKSYTFEYEIDKAHFIKYTFSPLNKENFMVEQVINFFSENVNTIKKLNMCFELCESSIKID